MASAFGSVTSSAQSYQFAKVLSEREMQLAAQRETEATATIQQHQKPSNWQQAAYANLDWSQVAASQLETAATCMQMLPADSSNLPHVSGGSALQQPLINPVQANSPLLQAAVSPQQGAVVQVHPADLLQPDAGIASAALHSPGLTVHVMQSAAVTQRQAIAQPSSPSTPDIMDGSRLRHRRLDRQPSPDAEMVPAAVLGKRKRTLDAGNTDGAVDDNSDAAVDSNDRIRQKRRRVQNGAGHIAGGVRPRWEVQKRAHGRREVVMQAGNRVEAALFRDKQLVRAKCFNWPHWPAQVCCLLQAFALSECLTLKGGLEWSTTLP